jgi:hypothetical protein
MSKDTPLHLDSESALEVTDFKVNEILERIEGPMDNILKGTKIVNHRVPWPAFKSNQLEHP